MMRLLHVIALLSYLNILCFEVKYCYAQNLETIAVGETFIEVVLEDVLNLHHNEEAEKVPEIMYDDYRIFALSLGLLPIVLYFSWILRRIFASNEQIKHTIYYLKRLILPGYYTFLYRYRPF
ncbi:MAG TPA: hypothetical protein VK023_05480 [Sphingobacterium bovisgrunnientis]|jgi:hypothetical protein|uniref:hypothetical protein n=1 Tax=Sphingobacterium cavernae TaxID=2592657 RepID=UPI00122FC757|nr:hypothetical protein [Sphingobacterium cavernae]HLS37704.1 hypothetical protein [Sphingobacterium bovisgrunnientis]